MEWLLFKFFPKISGDKKIREGISKRSSHMESAFAKILIIKLAYQLQLLEEFPSFDDKAPFRVAFHFPFYPQLLADR